MRLFRFDTEVAHGIDQYGSHGVSMVRGARFEGDAQVGCFHISPGGIVGYHVATRPQLFMCVSGEGWVTGADRARVPIIAGQAAYWVAGESHESGSEAGMLAVIVEGANVDPSDHMPEIELGEADAAG